jgi:spermidine/putrescine transport system ATP-binding protein
VTASSAPSLGTPPASDEAVLLTLRGVSKWFGDFRALEDVDLEVGRGEFLTLLGPSGCGKTTLLRIVGGFELPSRGEVRLDGRDLGSTPPERRPFNMVFQSYALFPHMTVWDNVAYGLRTARLPRATIAQRVSAALELVGLEDRARRSVRELSGGQQQRVALVRAIVNQPRILLLDEPLGALDLQLRKRMQDELRAIQAQLETTFVYVTHDQDEALSLSHRVALIQDGRVVQVGTPREVYERPRTRFVAEFVGDTNLLPCRADRDDGEQVEVTFPSGARRRLAQHGEPRLAPGERVLAALRPEHLRLAAPADAPFRGRLVGDVFHGAETFHDVRLDDGTLVRVRAAGDEPAPALGDEVGVDALPRRGVVVRAEQSAVEPAA